MIYFIQEGLHGNIKIGRTSGDPQKRVAQLQCGNPRKLRLIGTVSEEFNAEKDWHEAYGMHHIRGEWFCPSQCLLDDIKHSTEAEVSI